MSEMEEKLGAILNNPQMMQQILTMAQSLGSGQSNPKEVQNSDSPGNPSAPSFDPKLLQGLAGFAQQTGVDSNQQSLLHALSPYLSQGRIYKLERAMRAARMAGVASSFLNSGVLQAPPRR